PAIAVGQADPVGDPVRRLLALIGVVAAAVAGPLEGGLGLAEQRIVVGKSEQIIADVADGRIKSRRVIGAAGVFAADVVDHAVVAVNKGAIERFVAEVFAV